MKLALLSPMHLNAPTASPTPPTGGTLAPQQPDAFTPSTKLQRQGFNTRVQSDFVVKQIEAMLADEAKLLKERIQEVGRELGSKLGWDQDRIQKEIKTVEAAYKEQLQRHQAKWQTAGINGLGLVNFS